MIKRALVSVTDKTGVVEFCRALVAEFGVEIVSTGGTARELVEGGVPVRAIDDLTGFPEMMDGRVKTLHPRVHGGLLARRDNAAHMAAAAEHGIGMIDLVCVNLYAFEATVARDGVTEEDAIENIDIGGPSMLRSSAKNFESVTVVTSPADYSAVLEEMRGNGGATTLETRRRLAVEVYNLTSSYDRAIHSYLSGTPEDVRCEIVCHGPEVKFLELERAQTLRYGENPHQKATFYRVAGAAEYTLARAEQLQGKELSYNNILDTDGAWTAVREYEECACVIVKHTNPCGVSVHENLVEAYRRAHEADPVSAFGGVMAFNRIVTAELIQAIFDNKQFVEVMVAPEYEAGALELIATKPNVRVLRTGGVNAPGGQTDYRSVEGGVLAQNADAVDEGAAEFTVATRRVPSDDEMAQMAFAWKVCKSVKSNAIVVAAGGATVGVGAGQMNRVKSARIAVEQAGDKAVGAVAASDAFLPFADTMEVLAAAGVTALIQPGGSIRDEEVVAKADELGVAMVFTGKRHFRH